MTDGVCSMNGQPSGKAGLGIIFGDVEGEHMWSIPVDDTLDPGSARTSQRAELLAAIEGLRKVRELDLINANSNNSHESFLAGQHVDGDGGGSCGKIDIATDSEYVVKGITQWYPAWRANKWRNSQGKRRKNLDLYRRLDDLVVRV
ncbi:hypothetical protein H0H87_010931 [Tephrocybe sp. NHM501043]|nr:hypothetical protein H0H87_010931 [Tephrocybe sp. NHM501043]